MKKIIIFILIIVLFSGLNSNILAKQRSLEQRTLEAFDLSQDITYSQMQEILSLPKNREFIEARVRQYEFGKNWNRGELSTINDIGVENIIIAVVDAGIIIPAITITKISIELTRIGAEARKDLVTEYINLRKQEKSKEQA